MDKGIWTGLKKLQEKFFFSLCISAFTITTKFGIQIMRELNVRHNRRHFFQKLREYEEKPSAKNRNLLYYFMNEVSNEVSDLICPSRITKSK